VADPPFDWWDLGRDVLTALDDAGCRRPLGVGHSAGGAALVLAELLRPGTFASLLLIEPIILPPPFVRVEQFSMTEAALRRRAVFASREDALESFRGRGPFARWTPAALEAYIDHGFRDEDGSWRLKCDPEVEAEFYRSATVHGAWDRLGEVTCPVTVVGGEDSATHPRDFLERQAGRFRAARLEMVPGATHFVPMERPEAVARLVRDALEEAAGPGPRLGPLPR
jgi:pimeloyl-ACP methyl ester carboxylesterase